MAETKNQSFDLMAFIKENITKPKAKVTPKTKTPVEIFVAALDAQISELAKWTYKSEVNPRTTWFRLDPNGKTETSMIVKLGRRKLILNGEPLIVSVANKNAAMTFLTETKKSLLDTSEGNEAGRILRDIIDEEFKANSEKLTASRKK